MKVIVMFDKGQGVGIKVGPVGIGLIVFPWIYIFGNQPKYSVSFWEWLLCLPTFFINSDYGKFVQFRFMWFIVQIFSGKTI